MKIKNYVYYIFTLLSSTLFASSYLAKKDKKIELKKMGVIRNWLSIFYIIYSCNFK